MNRTEAYRKVAKIIAEFNEAHEVQTSMGMDHELAIKIYDSLVSPGPHYPIKPRVRGKVFSLAYESPFIRIPTYRKVEKTS
jgi:hypothetical protein